MMEICFFVAGLQRFQVGQNPIHSLQIQPCLLPSQDGVIHREKVYSLSFLYNVTLLQLQRSSLCINQALLHNSVFQNINLYILLPFKLSVHNTCIPSTSISLFLVDFPGRFELSGVHCISNAQNFKRESDFQMQVLKIDLTFNAVAIWPVTSQSFRNTK